MKKQLFTYIGLAAAVLLSACQGGEPAEENASDENQAWDAIEEKGTIVVATAGTLFPTSYHDDDNELTGFEVELVKEVADLLGVDVTFEEIGVETMTQALNSGRVHLAANSLAITEERQKNFDFSLPYKFSYGSAIVRADDLSGIETLEDLDGKIALGAPTTTYMQKAESYGAEPLFFDNVTNDVYLRAVETGQGDVILNDFYLQSITVEAMPDIDVVVHPTLFYDPSEQAFMMAKGEPRLKEAVDEALGQLLADGTASELSKQFFNGQDVTTLPDDIEFQ